MKSRSLFARRHVLTSVAAAAACVCLLAPQPAAALGLGRLVVQSALGEALRAEIDVTSLTPEESSNLRIRVAPPDAYRAAGVDYNTVLPGTQATLQRRADGRTVLRLASDRPVQEPFVDVILEATWSTGRLVREYTLLLDPPAPRARSAPAPEPAGELVQAVSPVFAAAQPTDAPPPAASPRAARRAPVDAAPVPQAAAPRPPRAPRETAVADAPPAPGGAPRTAAAGDYHVRRGDTLTRIASRTQPPGVSLEQMLIALYRNNPQAFIGGSIDRLRAGAVLAVPGADEAGREPRQSVRAQSADFDAYRGRLAGAAPALPAEGTRRQQAGGRVQASVDDRRQPASGADRLTLSGPASPAASAAERLARERESRDAARAAELRRNVDELQRLASAASATRAGTAPATAAASAAANVPSAVPAAANVPPAAPAAPTVAAAPATVPAPAATAASVPPGAAGGTTASPALPGPAATTAAGTAPPATAASAAPPAAASVATAAVPAPAVRPPAATPPTAADDAGERSFLDDNLPLVGLGALLVSLLAGAAYWVMRRRGRTDSGETSFLESRLPADSFFGASGGQRIDTRDTAGPSSMSYSLSQLDAIGDVDPLAEADVYLAYGRDLQAEEILKEAMRSSPERLAIRTKLLEVYAKRRDSKGFELLATQLYGLSGGTGEDWAKAQSLGAQVDPDNPLYHSGGRPPGPEGGGEPLLASTEPLGPSTMPQSVLPQQLSAAPPAPAVPAAPVMQALSAARPAWAAPTAPVAPPMVPDLPLDLDLGLDLDLDLDLDLAAPPRPAPAPEITTQPMAGFGARTPIESTDFELPFDTLPAASAAAAARSGGAAAAAPSPAMDFDLSDLPLDFDDSLPAAAPHQQAARSARPPITDFGAMGFDGPGDSFDPSATAGDESDTFERKIDLADEFRQIGDAEGARDLLLEVVARATGAQRAKAQSMLDALS